MFSLSEYMMREIRREQEEKIASYEIYRRSGLQKTGQFYTIILALLSGLADVLLKLGSSLKLFVLKNKRQTSTRMPYYQNGRC